MNRWRKIAAAISGAFLLCLFLPGAGKAKSASPIPGVWVQRGNTDYHFTPFVMSFHEDGRFEARRSLLRGGGRESYTGRWKFDGKQVLMSGVKPVHKQEYKFIPDEFKKCEIKIRAKDAFYSRYLVCNYQDFGGLRFAVPAGLKREYSYTPVITMGGAVHFMPHAAPIRSSPLIDYGAEEYCRIRVLLDFPFYRAICKKEIPAGQPVRVLGRSPDKEDWHLIEYAVYRLNDSRPFPVRELKIGWVRAKFSEATRTTHAFEVYPFKRPAAFFRHRPGRPTIFAGQWRQISDQKTSDTPMTLDISPDGRISGFTMSGLSGKKLDFRGSWSYRGRLLVLQPDESKNILDYSPLQKTECVYSPAPLDIRYGIWLRCTVRNYALSASKVRPGSVKKFNEKSVVILKGETRTVKKKVVPRADLGEFGEPSNYCFLRGKTDKEAKKVCVRHLPPGTKVKVLARTEETNAYPGHKGHAYLVEYVSVSMYYGRIRTTDYSYVRAFVPADF